jgi:hypothetical protein
LTGKEEREKGARKIEKDKQGRKTFLGEEEIFEI